jgi:bifunctional non-homologous end joining protein LigD
MKGGPVALRNLDKVLWPQAGFTKGDLVHYYRSVAHVLLPHLAGRPLTMRRFPDGVEASNWFQAECRGNPDWLATWTYEGKHGQRFPMCLARTERDLEWLANTGAVELHPFLWTVERPRLLDAVLFDLDPEPPAGLEDACRVALLVRSELELDAVVKTSGGLGMHVAAPIEPTEPARVRSYARSVADRLAELDPKVTARMTRRASRSGQVLVDWMQNDPARSTVAPYSLRGMPWPTVSMPVSWDEVEFGTRLPDRLVFVADEVLPRLERRGDQYAPMLDVKQRLPV